MSKTQKRYLISSVITFLSAFAISIIAQINSTGIEFSSAIWSGIFITGLRTGIKKLNEFLLDDSK